MVYALHFIPTDSWAIVLAAALGFAAIYWLLPRPHITPWTWGAVAGGLALVIAGVFIVGAAGLSAETILFYAFSAIAIVAGGLLITQRNPARAALSFALVVFSTCGLFLLQAAPFLMAATTIIYAGAIVVTFLFVIMLAQQEGPSDADQRSREPFLASLAGFILLGALLYVLQQGYGTREIDDVLAQVRQARDAPTLEAMKKVGGDDPDSILAFFRGRFVRAVLKGGATTEATALAERVINLASDWNEWVAGFRGTDVEQARKIWVELETIGLQARASYGALQPPPDLPLSNQSGPPANLALFEGKAIRRDKETLIPEMPHENTAYLGRALFTDFLLPVELGGTLLLVATIGAIAIAGRRGERKA